MANCIFTTGSVTYSMKAKQLLWEYAIPANTVKLSTSQNKKGCIYGIEFPCGHKSNVSRILAANGVSFEEYDE